MNDKEQLEACVFYNLERSHVVRLHRLAKHCDAGVVQTYRAVKRLCDKGMAQRVGWGAYTTRQMTLPGIELSQ